MHPNRGSPGRQFRKINDLKRLKRVLWTCARTHQFKFQELWRYKTPGKTKSKTSEPRNEDLNRRNGVYIYTRFNVAYGAPAPRKGVQLVAAAAYTQRRVMPYRGHTSAGLRVFLDGFVTFTGPAAGSVIFSSPFARYNHRMSQSRLIAVADGNFHTRGTAVRPTLPRAPKEGRIRDERCCL